MGASILRDCKLWVGGYNLSGDSNRLAYKDEYDKLEIPAFGYAAKRRIAGLPSVAFEQEGWMWSDGTTGPDDALSALRGVTGTPITIGPLTGAAGESGWFSTITLLQLSHGGEVSSPYSFKASGEGNDYPLIHGTILENSAKTSTGSGTVRTLGAVTSTQKIYAALHVLAVSGTNPTLDMTVLSAVTNWGTPTTRITFAQKTAVGAQFATPVAGPVTDTYWRAAYTIGGTNSPSFTVAVVVGIQ